MKKAYSITKYFLAGLAVVLFSTAQSYAQLGKVDKILQSSIEDANVLVKEYLRPFGPGFGAGLNTGWTNTAKPHKKLGFDLTISTALAVVPTSGKSFDVTQIGLQQLELESGPSVTQTISGDNNAQPTTLAAYETIDGQRTKLFEFDMPTGTGFGFVPAPEIKAGVGLIKDTDIMLRYVPKVGIGDYGDFKQFGVGAKHGINQWLPGGNLLPVDLSLMAGYTNMTTSANFRITGEDIITEPNNTENPYANQPETWDGQNIEIDTKAFTINALVGKTLPVISVYGGLGYETANTSITTPGTYPTIEANPDYQGGTQGEDPLIVGTLDQPVNVGLDGKNNFHALAGFRLRFTIFHISASYKLADYSVLNAAFGISFR